MPALNDGDLDALVAAAMPLCGLIKKLEAAVDAGDHEAAWAVAVEMCKDEDAEHHPRPAVVPPRRKPARTEGPPEAD